MKSPYRVVAGLAFVWFVCLLVRQADAQPGPPASPPPPPTPFSDAPPASAGSLAPPAVVGSDPLVPPSPAPQPPRASPRPRPGMTVEELEKHLDHLDAGRAELDKARQETVAALRQKLQEQKKAVADLEKRLQERGVVQRQEKVMETVPASLPAFPGGLPAATEPPKSR